MAFSPTAALGITPKPYADYFQDGDDPGATVFKGLGYSAPDMLASPIVTPYDTANIQQTAKEKQYGLEQRQRQLAANQELTTGGTDWSTPEGQSHLQDLVAQGVIDPQHARAIEYANSVQARASKQGALNKYSPVDAAVVKAAAPLETINPTAPDAWDQMTGVLQGIDNNPDYAGSQNPRPHPYFNSILKGLQNKIEANALHRAALGAHDPDQKQIMDAVRSGVDPEDITQFTDETGKKVIDPLGLASATYKASKGMLKPPVAQVAALSNLGAQAQARLGKEPNDADKSAWLQAAGIDPSGATPAQWAQAYDSVKHGPQRQYEAQHDLLTQQFGSKYLPQKIQFGNAQPAATPQLPQVNSPDEAAKLPKGSFFLDPNGVKRQVP